MGALAIVTTRTASASLLAIGALHALWATGSPWPLADRASLADVVAGQPADRAPSPAACLAVTGALVTAAALVGGRPRSRPRVRRAGAAGVVATLATRGAFGLAGRTDLLSPGATSERFRARDRRLYSPLCLGLAGLAAPAAGRRAA